MKIALFSLLSISPLIHSMQQKPEQSINPTGKETTESEKPLPPVIVIITKGEEEIIRKVMNHYTSRPHIFD